MTWMSRWKLGSMVSKWVISPTSKWGVVGGITHLLTSGDIQVGPILVAKSNLMELRRHSSGMRDFTLLIGHCLKFAWCHIINHNKSISMYICCVYTCMYIYI